MVCSELLIQGAQIGKFSAVIIVKILSDSSPEISLSSYRSLEIDLHDSWVS